MPKTSEIDWIALCPEEFREKFKGILNHPPGSPEGAEYYCYSEDDVFVDSYLGESSQMDEESRRRKKFADAWGTYAEAITIRYLISLGLPIREWNWSPKKGRGEIDIITQRGNRIIFIEVKARSGKHSDPWDSITSAKIKDLCHGADIYLKMQTGRYEYQFDVALLTGRYDNYQFEYIEDAFLCPLTTRR